MKKLISIVFILFSFNVLADLPDIVAIVNDQPITKYEFEERKKLIVLLQKVDVSDSVASRKLDNNIIHMMIDEILVDQYTDRMGWGVSDQEIDEAIATFSQKLNIPKGGMQKYLKSSNADYAMLRQQIRGELMRQGLMTFAAQSVVVSPSEVDTALLLDGQNLHVTAWLFTSKDGAGSAKNNMASLKKRLSSCSVLDSKLYNQFANGQQFNQTLVQFPEEMQSTILDTQIDHTSAVYKQDGVFKMILVCKKDFALSQEDLQKVKLYLSNKKAVEQTQKLLKDLRIKADIKIMLPM